MCLQQTKEGQEFRQTRTKDGHPCQVLDISSWKCSDSSGRRFRVMQVLMDSDREPEWSVVYPARPDAACASQRAIDTSVLNTFSETLNIFDTTPLQLFQFVFFLNKPMSMISGHSPKYHFKLSLMTLMRTEFHPDPSSFTSIRMVGRMAGYSKMYQSNQLFTILPFFRHFMQPIS